MTQQQVATHQVVKVSADFIPVVIAQSTKEHCAHYVDWLYSPAFKEQVDKIKMDAMLKNLPAKFLDIANCSIHIVAIPDPQK